MRFNVSKSTVVRVGLRYKRECVGVTLNGVKLPFAKKARYFGVFIATRKSLELSLNERTMYIFYKERLNNFKANFIGGCLSVDITESAGTAKQTMYTDAAGDAVTSLNGAVVPAQVALHGMRSEAASTPVPRGLELLEVQQRVHMFDCTHRAQHYQRLHAALLPTSNRVFPTTSSTLQTHPTAAAVLGCSGLLSFIYSCLLYTSPSPRD